MKQENDCVLGNRFSGLHVWVEILLAILSNTYVSMFSKRILLEETKEGEGVKEIVNKSSVYSQNPLQNKKC